MNMTSSKHPNSIVLGAAKIEVSTKEVEIDSVAKNYSLVDLMDLGLARGIKIGFASSKIDIKADNGDVPIKGITGMKGTVEFNLLERHIPTLGKVMGGLVNVSVQGKDAKNFVETIKANSVQVDAVVEFKKQNFDLTVPTAVVLKQGSKTLSKGTDYEIVQKENGLWAIVFKSSGTFDITKDCNITYSVSEIKSYTLTRGSGGIASPLAMKLTARRIADNGKMIERTFEFPFGFYDGEDSITFKSKNDGDNVIEVPMKFEFTPHPDMLIDPELEVISLYREIAEEA